jgi:hypothetical protein
VPASASHADDLTVALGCARQPRLQDPHLVRTSHEARETTAAHHLEAPRERPGAFELVHTQRLTDALDPGLPKGAQRKQTGDQLRGVSRQEDTARRRELLHPRRQPDRVPLRRVVHAQIVADLADDHLTGVETHADRETEAVAQSQVVRVAAQPVAEMQRRVAGALRVVLVRDGRPE